MSNNGPRYQARNGSRHDCCHDAQVIDTLFYAPGSTGRHRQICECDDIETAIIIARALNKEAMS